MSSQNPPQAPQQTPAETAYKQISMFFNEAGTMRSQPRMRGLRGVCRFDVAGAGTWSVGVNDGEVTVIEGAGTALPSDCVVSCSAEDFLRIVGRENYLSLLTAALQGLVTVTGDKVFAAAFLGSVIAAPLAAMQQR